jgi:hypothetical protein
MQYQLITYDQSGKVLNINERQDLINKLNSNEKEELIIKNLNNGNYLQNILIFDDFQYMDDESGNLILNILNQTKNTLILALNTTNLN